MAYSLGKYCKDCILNKFLSFLFQEITVATVDLEDIRTFRNSKRSLAFKAAASPSYPRISVNMVLGRHSNDTGPVNAPLDWIYYKPEEEIAMGPACWLWDYLRSVISCYFYGDTGFT